MRHCPMTCCSLWFIVSTLLNKTMHSLCTVENTTKTHCPLLSQFSWFSVREANLKTLHAAGVNQRPNLITVSPPTWGTSDFTSAQSGTSAGKNNRHSAHSSCLHSLLLQKKKKKKKKDWNVSSFRAQSF